MALSVLATVASQAGNECQTGQVHVSQSKANEKVSQNYIPVPTSKTRWMGDRCVISYTAGQCAGCHHRGVLGLNCFKCGLFEYTTIPAPSTSAKKQAWQNTQNKKKRTQRLTDAHQRVKEANAPFLQWMATCCDISEDYSAERVRISFLFCSYKNFCDTNGKKVLMSTHSNIKGLKFTEAVINGIAQHLPKPNSIKLTKDRTGTYCFPFLKVNT